APDTHRRNLFPFGATQKTPETVHTVSRQTPYQFDLNKNNRNRKIPPRDPGAPSEKAVTKISLHRRANHPLRRFHPRSTRRYAKSAVQRPPARSDRLFRTCQPPDRAPCRSRSSTRG